MAEQKLNKKVPSEKSKSSGIKKRWITNNIIIVMVVVVVILTTIGVLLHRSYYDSVKNNLEIRANTQAKYINTYMTSSYVEFYEWVDYSTCEFVVWAYFCFSIWRGVSYV
jgi:hypothetical protein